MYRLLKEKKSEDSEENEDDEDINSDTEENDNENVEGGESDDFRYDEMEVPDDYIFSGFFCVCCLGTICIT